MVKFDLDEQQKFFFMNYNLLDDKFSYIYVRHLMNLLNLNVLY